MAIGLSSIFTPGFTTSKPGDMKNNSGMMNMNMYAGIAPKNHRSLADIKVEPRTEFDLDLARKPARPWSEFAMPSISAKDFEREYTASFSNHGIEAGFDALAGSTTNGTAGASPTLSLESIEKMKLDIAKYAHRAPVVSRDTPESAPIDAW